MRRAWRWVLLSLVLLVAAAGCKTLTADLDTARALRDDGFTSVSVSNHLSSGSSRVSVTASSGLERGQREAARVVWVTFPLRFDRLTVTLNGQTQDFTHGDLESMFGPRPGNLDSRTLSGETTRLGVAALIAFAVMVLVVLVVVLLIVRSSRRRRARAPAPWGPPPGWRPPPGGPGPYGPPPGWPQPGQYPPQPYGPPPGPPGWPPQPAAPAPSAPNTAAGSTLEQPPPWPPAPPPLFPTSSDAPTGSTSGSSSGSSSGWSIPPAKPTPPRRPAPAPEESDQPDESGS